jgi:hypothetical protein
MIIQNFAQLDSVYGKEDAETIRGNCGNIIYLITTELKALEEISKMCGEVKSKKDDKTASTPLVTVSDLQRMKQFEVIILRMRKQPFKTKFTPFFKIDWGKKYPAAKYPVREKQELHTFDIKEFVKSEKKKKLLEMMNSADEKDKENGGFGKPNPIVSGLPPELQAARQNRNSQVNIPDFLTRSNPDKNNDIIKDSSLSSNSNHVVPNIPDFETFKREMENDNSSFNPFGSVSTKQTTPTIPTTPKKEENDSVDDDLGFDVDELVKKIDAKIAELEAEEKKNKEEEEKKQKESQATNPVVTSVNTPSPTNSINDIYNLDSTKEIGVVSNNSSTSTVTQTASKPVTPATINLDDDGDDDDFFDDFFDN